MTTATVNNISHSEGTEKPKSVLKGLRHGIVGMGTMWAVSSLITVPLSELKTQQQITDGLVQMDTLPTAPQDRMRHLQKMDVLAAVMRGVTPYSLKKLLHKQFDNDRTMRLVSAALTNVAVAVPEMWRLELRADIYSQQIGASEQHLSIVRTDDSAGEKKKSVGAVVRRVAPFILYESLLAILGEYVVKPRMEKVVKDNLTFVSTDKEADAWSDFFTGLTLRCVTVPVEGVVKRRLAGVSVQPLESAAGDSAEKHSGARRKALVKSVLYTIPIVAAPLVQLYAYRGLSSVFDRMGL